MGPSTRFAFPGRVPPAATHGLYSDLIAMAQARSIPVFLDTYGPALAAIGGFWPTVIQLNRREAALHLRKPGASDRDVAALLDEWSRRGVHCAVVTDGPNPVLIIHRGKSYRAAPPRINPVNPIGSGDCLLAGLVDGWLSGLEPEPLVAPCDRLCCGQCACLGRRSDRDHRGRPMARPGGRRARRRMKRSVHVEFNH